VEFNQIRYFLNLADTLNFTEAALRSGVSRPTLTRARQRLEQELGGTLVFRDGKDSRLTALGRDIRSEFAAIAEREQRVRALSLNRVRGRRETLTRGVVNTIAPALITGFITHALRHFGTKLGTPRISGFTPELEIADKVRGRLLLDPMMRISLSATSTRWASSRGGRGDSRPHRPASVSEQCWQTDEASEA
jgi:DNA-binding transcriptional LysR family regulator